MEKNCADCGVKKPVEEFQRKSQNKDGRDSYCKACKASRQKAYLAKHLECPVRREKYRASQVKWEKSDPARAKAFRHRRWLKLREGMLNAYGRSCSCCGESSEEFLTLEHVNRDGSAHRKLVGSGANTYRDLQVKGWPKDGYTVLCMNCNWAVRRGGICPHKRS